MSYQSPIDIICEQVRYEMEDAVMKAVQDVGINVNKIELQKALMYDRKQYTQGFEDGRKSIEEDYRSMERTVNKLAKALAEAKPIRHGRWVIEPDDTVMCCDVCDWVFEYYGGLEEEWNYCPHCGAKMDEVVE